MAVPVSSKTSILQQWQKHYQTMVRKSKKQITSGAIQSEKYRPVLEFSGASLGEYRPHADLES